MQALWDQFGPDAMDFSVLEPLSYEDPQEDHTEELELLREIWLEKDPQAKKICADPLSSSPRPKI